MRLIVALFMILLCMPIALASILLDDWVSDRESFKAGDHYFYVKYIESNDKLLFKMDDVGGMMSPGECETKGGIKYCFEDEDNGEIKVLIESQEPHITITRSFSEETLSLDDETTVSVTLKNDGDKTANNVKYIDNYPLGLRVYGKVNAGVWDGNLNVGEEESFKYTIKGEDVVSFDSIAEVSYSFDGKKKTIKSDSVTIDVQAPYEINDVISTQSADKNEIVTYNVSIENKRSSHSLDIKNLEIAIPKNVQLVDAPRQFNKKENKLVFEGSIEKQKEENFVIKVKSSRVGKFTITTSASFEIAGKRFQEILEKTFNVGLSNIIPTLDMTSEVNSNSAYDVYIALKNCGKERINNININVISGIFDDINEIKNIEAGDTIQLYKKTLTAPYTEEEKKFNVIIKGSYLSSSGRQYNFEKSQQLKVKAVPKVVKTIRELNKEKFYKGDKIEITVKVQNQKNMEIDEVDVTDIFPKEIRSSLEGEVTAYLGTLAAREEREAYSYSLEIPEDYNEEEIEFTTNVNAKVDGELVIIKKIDKVSVLGEKPLHEMIEEVREMTVNGTEEIGETEEVNKTEEPKEIKEGFFKRIINWVKNLFKK